MTQLRAVLAVTIETRENGDYYYDHDDLIANVIPWVEGGLEDRDDIVSVTITEHPPVDRTALRDRIAAALYERERPPRDPHWPNVYAADREVFEAMADAVLPALPAPADRADVLTEAADRLSARAEELRQAARWHSAQCWDAAADMLRRMADEAQPSPDLAAADNPTPLRWGLNDVMWGDDDTVTVLLSGPDREPYWLELDPERAAVLRQDLAGPDGEEQATESEVVHGCPPDGSGLTPCCGRTPFELPLGDRMSSEAPITCPGVEAQQDGAQS